jgi:Zn-finger protein
MDISCDDCVMQHSAACAECVVTHVLGAEGEVELDAAVERAIRLLINAGLVPATPDLVAC